MGVRLHLLIVVYHVLNYSLFAGTEAREDRIWAPSASLDTAEVSLESTCHHSDVTTYLKQLVRQFPNISRLISIGNSTQGRELWTVVISDNPTERLLLKPQVKFVGNINGYSGSACVVLIKLIKFLLENYSMDEELIRRLVHSTEIHILPNVNPDGYADSLPGECNSNRGRLNGNLKDLNRDFPDMHHPLDTNEDDPMPQQETTAIMEWMTRNSFIVSASFISGAQVVSYPYDSTVDNYPQGLAHETLGPDDKTFQSLARRYVDFVNKPSVADWYCPLLNKIFPEGFINGAEWHSVSGTMMDYNYAEGTFEILIGLGCCKNNNNTDSLTEIWLNNKYAMLSIIEEAAFSLRGQILNADTNLPLSKVQIMTLLPGDDHHADHTGIRMPYFSNERGEFWRVLPPGKYFLLVTLKGYENQIIPVEINDERPPDLIIRMKAVYARRRAPPIVQIVDKNLLHEEPELRTPSTRLPTTTQGMTQQPTTTFDQRNLNSFHENKLFSSGEHGPDSYNVDFHRITNLSKVSAYHEVSYPNPKALTEAHSGSREPRVSILVLICMSLVYYLYYNR